jgi:hypothetical protein
MAVCGPAQAQVDPPAPDVGIEAYNALDGWIRSWTIPAAPALPKGLEAMGACAVTLRLDHRVIARAADFSKGGDALVIAARQAIAQATPRLPVGHDALAEQQIKDAAARITISLELAGALIPIKPATFAEVDAQLQPGLDGIAARFDEKVAGLFPAAMLTMNTTPSDALAGAISEASGDPKLAIRSSSEGQPGAIAVSHQAIYYRFRAAHLAQVKEHAPPMFLFRGGRVVSEQDVSTASLRKFGADLAGNLIKRAKLRGDQGGLSGTMLPAQGRFDPAMASVIEQALAGAALAEYSRIVPGPGATEPLTTACDLLNDLLKDRASRPAIWEDPVSAAAWLIAAADVHAADPARLPVAAAPHAKLGAAVSGAYDPDTGWAGVPEGGKALVALALAYEADDQTIDATARAARRARADSALRSIYQATKPDRLVAHMPWLGRAEMVLAEPGKDVPAAAALRDARDKVWEHQLTAADAGEDAPDLIGGIVFTASRNPLPTWQSVRPIIFLAQMAGEPRLTDSKEYFPQIAHLLASMRFLRQLMLDEAAAYSAEDPEASIGGIRSSLWDQRQPVEATAMTLMAVCEMLQSLKKAPKE